MTDDLVIASGQRIERLLDEVRATVDPSGWWRVEELVREVVAVYGAGLERVLRCVEETGEPGRDLQARICRDPLISSLLSVHDLHPEPIEQRVRSAIDEALRQLGARAPAVEIIELRPGSVSLRIAGGSPRADEAIERALAAAVPELDQIEVSRADDRPTLVQIDLQRSRSRRAP